MDFSDLKYVGTKTGRDQFTDFTKLRKIVQEQLKNNNIRAPRKPEIIYKTFEVIVIITDKPLLGFLFDLNIVWVDH